MSDRSLLSSWLHFCDNRTGSIGNRVAPGNGESDGVGEAAEPLAGTVDGTGKVVVGFDAGGGDKKSDSNDGFVVGSGCVLRRVSTDGGAPGDDAVGFRS